ncbi:hypothetical protein OC835_002106 [Tilletia horrida]|uniref:Peptidase A1 domain-containing protein n=1 Tax=Tilletia horrida TaxID=155126 RepID=A0AAN6G8L0_9BASI|nr:hypothetical protein OC842_007328 [Tilletia horrida]KAK0536208.1 hypothetical protein OC835_002106 [Tilletia horrida]
MLFSSQRWAALALFSLASLSQLNSAAATQHDDALQHHHQHPRAEDGTLLPLADRAKIQRFIKNVGTRYAQAGSPPANKWESASARAQGLDTTIASSDNKVQADILQQIAQALKAGIDRVGEELAKVVPEASLNGQKLIPRMLGGSTGNQGGGAVITLPLRDMVQAEQQDAEYLAEVQIGTPPSTYLLQADSGSSDAWVASARCNTPPCKGVGGARARYNTSFSSTYSPTPSNRSFELYYSIGGVKGRMIRDIFTFKGLSGAALTIRSQTFGLASLLSSDFAKDPTDGVLGLGFRALTTAGERPVLQNLFAQNKQLKSQVVAFFLGRKASGTDTKSEMRIGDTNPALYKGEIRYVPVSTRAYWAFRFGNFGVGGASAQNTVSGSPNSNLEGVVDTGTSYIAMNYDAASTFWNAIPEAQSVAAYGYWVMPCAKLNKLVVNFTLPDGTAYTLNPRDLNAGVAYSGSSNCIGTVFSADTGNKVIFGASLLKSLYLVLDWGANRIGFAQAAI